MSTPWWPSTEENGAYWKSFRPSLKYWSSMMPADEEHTPSTCDLLARGFWNVHVILSHLIILKQTSGTLYSWVCMGNWHSKGWYAFMTSDANNNFSFTFFTLNRWRWSVDFPHVALTHSVLPTLLCADEDSCLQGCCCCWNGSQCWSNVLVWQPTVLNVQAQDSTFWQFENCACICFCVWMSI